MTNEAMTDTLSLLVALGGDENGVLCLRVAQEFKIHWRCLQDGDAQWWQTHLNYGNVIVSPPFVRSDHARCDVCGESLT